MLYFLSMLKHTYNIVIEQGVGAPGYVKEVVDSLNSNEKRFNPC